MTSAISASLVAGALLLGSVGLATAQQHGHGHHGQGHHGQGHHGQGHQGSTAPAPAQQGAAPAPHQHGGSAAAPAAGEHPSVAAFRAANDRMHRDMDIRFSGNADADFVRGMIPHHQGAIDMAKVVLEHGKDEQTRKWAADIIREQEREIGEMRAWLARNGQR
jgi:uncharacterized protein (DUF305 family)